jgi:hypothetical protein
MLMTQYPLERQRVRSSGTGTGQAMTDFIESIGTTSFLSTFNAALKPDMLGNCHSALHVNNNNIPIILPNVTCKHE